MAAATAGSQAVEAFPWSLETFLNKLFINNEYIDAASRITFQLQNPKDGSPLSVKVPVAGEVDIDCAEYYITPTVFESGHRDAEIIRQEIFGPVAILNKFKDEKEVINLANYSEYGLMAGVFTQDVSRALRVTSELESGNVGINCISMIFTNVPFGGTKTSGYGRENGKDVLFLYTEPKTVFINLMY